MRGSIAVLCMALALAGCAAHTTAPTVTSDTGTSPSSGATQTAPEERAAGQIEVRGEMPAFLAGTWLMIQSPFDTKRYTNSWTVYEISKQGARWSMHQLVGKAAPELFDAVKKANTAGEPLQPDQALLEVVTGMLPSLAQPPPEERNKQYIFATPDQLPPEQRDTPQIKDAKLTFGILGGSSNAVGGANYFVKEMKPDFLAGGFEAGMVARPAGLPPVPIGFNGKFSMSRLK